MHHFPRHGGKLSLILRRTPSRCDQSNLYRCTSGMRSSCNVVDRYPYEYYIHRMSTENVKTEAIRLLQRLPDDVTWDDLMHEIYVRQSIEAGLADSKAGKTVDVTA